MVTRRQKIKKYRFFFLAVLTFFFCIFVQKAESASQVTISSPANNAYINQGSTISVSGTYSWDQNLDSNGGTISFLVGTTLMSSQSADLSAGSHSFSFSWDTTGYQGAYTLTVKLSNSSGSSVSSSVNVTVFFISQSADLWWFNGADASNYAEEITLTANGLPSGTFNWSITQGSDKVTLINPNSNPVTLKSIGASSPPGKDVKIQLKYNGEVLQTHSLTVYTCGYCKLLFGYPTDETWPFNFPPYGYWTTYRFQLKDQFGNDLPKEIEVNESFGPFVSDWQGENWDEGTPNSVFTVDGAKVRDNYRALKPWPYEPTTTNPFESGSWDKVKHAQQYYKTGSLIIGMGKLIKQHKVQLYRGRGRQE